MIETDPIKIEKGLQKIHRAKRAIISLFLGFIPYSLLASFISDKFNIHFMFLLGGYSLVVIIADYYFGLTSTCPRCNEFYYWRMTGIGYRYFFTKKCLNCGLELNKKTIETK
jgi:hypothetical protein